VFYLRIRRPGAGTEQPIRWPAAARSRTCAGSPIVDELIARSLARMGVDRRLTQEWSSGRAAEGHMSRERGRQLNRHGAEYYTTY
jgi:hypothetical protein